MTRWTFCAVLLATAFGARHAVAQTNTTAYATTFFDITHHINMPPVPIPGVDEVQAEYFVHVWRQEPMWTGIGYEYKPGGPGYQPPPGPYNAMPANGIYSQPPAFNPYGIERLGTNTSHYGVWAEPHNWCAPGYGPITPSCVSVGSPITTAQHDVPMHGTYDNPGNPLWPPSPPYPPYDIGWLVQVSDTTAGYATAASEYHIEPRTAGSGYFAGRMRTFGRSHEGYDPYLPDRTYAFAWSQLNIKRGIKPQYAGQAFSTAVPVSWGLNVGATITPPAAGYSQFVPSGAWNTKTRFYDPISFVVTDPSSGVVLRTGELFQLAIELSLGGSFNGSNGGYMLDTQHGGLRVHMDHPFISPRGTLDIEIANGIVVTSRATGCFASMALPGVGSAGAHWISFPTPTFDFVFDASSVFTGDHDVTLFMSGGGAELLPEFEPTGGACVAGVCSSGKTESETLAAGGTWQGPGTACASFPYYVEEPLGGFEDISSFGVPSVVGNCDDCGETVPLGFTFNYLGTPWSTVGIASNGYLAFNGPLDLWVNQPIPSTGGPTNFLAGYWDDLNPLSGGDVHYATLGVVPNRRFIAQWTDVPHWYTDYLLHTFQIVLHEGTDAIEYVYLDTPVVGFDPTPIAGDEISPTIGIENAAGTRGIALDPVALTPKGSRRFVPAPGTGCAPASSVAYCTAGTTTNNCTAMMSSTGTPSASATSGFVVNCNGIEGQKQTIMFYGTGGAAALPWGLGSTSYLCVTPPMQRMVGLNSVGTVNQCNGTVSIDLLAYFAANPIALGVPFSPGQQCWLQSWFRDPPTPKTTNLSNGLHVTFVP